MGTIFLIAIIAFCIYFISQYNQEKEKIAKEEEERKRRRIQIEADRKEDEIHNGISNFAKDSYEKKYKDTELFKFCFQHTFDNLISKLKSIKDVYYQKTEIDRYECHIDTDSFSLFEHRMVSHIAPGTFGLDEIFSVNFNERGYELTNLQVSEFTAALEHQLRIKLFDEFSKIKYELRQPKHCIAPEVYINIDGSLILDIVIIDCYKEKKDLFS